MPTYDYKCDSCGEIEVFQRMSDSKLTQCPNCGGNISKLVSRGGGIIFKGSGFYETDYKKKNKSTVTKSESSPKAPSKHSEKQLDKK
mgnify:CR=1 FL=1|jgi:putative FmdB family regulatory protein